ncbi:hypothetical protein [Desulfovibrio inopinatus]|uniref:hypothetical protein n=1 Tax=Desulfovibrio inopinatus TaxID=102109 RepID=UPI0004232590|nr:hypothetical protein [Desulfovibrio inopinatus]
MTDEIATARNEKSEQRLNAYLKRLNQLKETNTIKELAERDILMEFIMANKERIDEFPMLAVEQQSILSMVCSRMEEAAGIEQLRDWVTRFMLNLSKYRSAVMSDDEVEQKIQRTQIFNLETILLKCIQAAVYTSALIKDNFNDVIIRHYGEGALSKIDEFTESVTFDASYWNVYFDFFVFTLVSRAYEDIVANSKIQVSKRGNYLLLHFPFEEVLAKLQGTEKKIEATRIQQAFDDTATDTESKRIKNFIYHNLFEGDAAIDFGHFSETETDFIVRMASIDPASRELLNALGLDETEGTARTDANTEETASSPESAVSEEEDEQTREAQRSFLREQVIASAAGAGIVLALAHKDCDKALANFERKERQVILKLIGSFRREGLGRALRQMLEFSFTEILREKGREEGPKIQVRAMRSRCISSAMLDGLAQNGLNRIRSHRFFEKESETIILFKQQTPQEFKEQLQLLQIERPLQVLMIKAWEQADFKVEILVVINVPLVARGTTNLPKRLAEIMNAYGVRPQTG